MPRTCCLQAFTHPLHRARGLLLPKPKLLKLLLEALEGCTLIQQGVAMLPVRMVQATGSAMLLAPTMLLALQAIATTVLALPAFAVAASSLRRGGAHVPSRGPCGGDLMRELGAASALVLELPRKHLRAPCQLSQCAPGGLLRLGRAPLLTEHGLLSLVELGLALDAACLRIPELKSRLLKVICDARALGLDTEDQSLGRRCPTSSALLLVA
mmetsp:Transcript_108060/g.241106  ORF Transcript_108060/g.241106 Transcript_108060/m.241106 type:complete len:212 (-) Transcript_108060:510-1145(-)